MKKQLLIAAVAATMTSVAFADISITGGMKVNYTNTDKNSVTSDTVSHELDLQVTGKTGATTVYMELNNDSADGTNAAAEPTKYSSATTDSNFDIEDAWMQTSIGSVAVKAGTWNGTDTILAADSGRTTGNWILSSDVSGVNVALEGDSNASKTKVTLKGDISGVSAKYVMNGSSSTAGNTFGKASDELYLSTDIAGFGVTYAMIDSEATTADAAAFTVSKEFNGVTISYSEVDADALYTVNGDTAAFGDAATFMNIGDDASSIKLATSVAGNTVSARFVKVDALVAANDVDVNTFTVTRPLANGTTLEVTYTDTDESTATTDNTVLDVELAVKF